MILKPEQSKIMNSYYEQCREEIMVKVDKLKLTCRICNKQINIRRLYRCYLCGLYICEKCAPDHFRIKVEKKTEGNINHEQ